MVVAGVILVEIKVSGTIEKYAEAQILNYLKAAGVVSACCSILDQSLRTNGS
jgi:hypothetical protein